MEIPTGEEIREAREDRGLTQAALAERADVSQPLIARIENKDVDPTLETLHRIVVALNDREPVVDSEEIELFLPDAVRDTRERTGYTQGELADVADVSQPLISRIENSDVNPRASTLREIFQELDTEEETEDHSPDEERGILDELTSEFEEL